uniref:Syntaxin-binding protein 5-like n=1 Tax=Denticeps clupeoides TaxID=299321 RepID=A0AAY4EDB1_9TELE
MRKFNIRKVLDGLTAANTAAPTQPPAARDTESIPESLQSEHFQLCKTVRHGFPYQPSALAFDPLQKLLAVGTQSGALRLFGRPGVECHCQHETSAAVLQIQFLINEGALVSALADDSIHLWNLRQKRPAVLHSLKFNRERITFCHLPFQSKWLYVGTERGNIHIVNVETFSLSGYTIMWNKAIELSSKAHPGPVVHISDNPADESKLMIGFESGIVVLWDLKSKKADYRYTHDEAIHSISWHHEGKQFICSHSDGSLTIWNIKNPAKPAQTIIPHGKQPKDGKKPDPCKPILKVEYKTIREGEPFIVLSGGLPYDTVGRRPCLTVMHGKSTAVLEMDFPIVDFLTLCQTPYPNDFQEPYAVVVLLEKDLVVIDLTQNGYPVFENPYPLTLHESPVTCCEYCADCPVDLVPALYGAGLRQKRQGYSKKEWPISGGNWGQGTQTYPEIIITGHADGSVKFWDASAIMLQVLYKLKTAKVFEKRSNSKDEKASTEMTDEDPFAIQLISWCPESRVLCVAGVSAHILIYRFSKQEIVTEVLQWPCGHVCLLSVSEINLLINVSLTRVRSSSLKQSAGYQVELVVQLLWVGGDPPQPISTMSVNSAYGLVTFGNSSGVAVVDYLQKTLLLNVSATELYSPSEQRQPRSPRKNRGKILQTHKCNGLTTSDERCKSPTSVCVLSNGCVICLCLSLTVLLSVCPSRAAVPAENRDGAFTRSRSSSVTSIERDVREAITALSFCYTFSRKADGALAPCMWVGTSLGTVLTIALSLPPAGEQRQLQPATASPCGTLMRMKGSILRMGFLDAGGCFLSPPYEPWNEPNTSDDQERERGRRRRAVWAGQGEGQFAVLCSDKEAKVLALPTQVCVSKHSITETSFLLRADIVQMGAGVCVACFCANGHIMTLSLPGLRPLLDVNYLPLTDMRIARTFSFSNLGQAMYLSSPTEIQRLTYSQEVCESLQEMLAELFIPIETPEAPNRGFFKGFFGGAAQSLDREELFGESGAGKASRSLAQHIPGQGSVEGMKGAASGVVGELARARLALDERGQKLSEVEEKTAAMMASADAFSKHAHEMMLKYKDKKWYQF